MAIFWISWLSVPYISAMPLGDLCVCCWRDMLNCQHRPLIWLFLNMTFLYRFVFCSTRSLICVFVCTPSHRIHLKIKSGFIDYTALLFRHVFWWCCKCSCVHVGNKCMNRQAVTHKMQCMDTCIFLEIAIYATDIADIESCTHFT